MELFSLKYIMISIRSLVLASMLFITSCASVAFSNLPIEHALPINGITVEGNKIIHNGKLFAELKYYFTANLAEKYGEAYLFSANTQHRGLAIYYYNEDKIVWIFPKEGRDEDIERGHFRARGQTDGYVGWVYDVKLSEDGKYVYYKKPGLISTSSFVFSVEHGASRLIDRDWHL